MYALSSGEALWATTARSTSPSKRKTWARSASHSRMAFSASVSKTGWRSKVERPITLSSSLVAVCCSRATRSSLLRAPSSVKRRTFSTAMTAWSAKVLRSSTCVSENSPGSDRATKIAPTTCPSRSMGTPRDPRNPAARAPSRNANSGSSSTSGTWTIAEVPGPLGNDLEHGLHVRRRAANHAQDLAGRRLLLQGLGERGVLVLELGEEPRVLDGDGRLVGEGLEEGNLAVREGPDLVPIDHDHPEQLARSQHGN